MDDLNPQPVAPTPPVEQHSKNWLKIVVFSLVGVLAAAGLVFAGYSIGNKQAATEEPQVTTQTTPSPTPDPTADWKTYKITTMNMEFKLPPEMSKYGELKEELKAVPQPFNGKVFCMTFPSSNTSLNHVCSENIFALGAISNDYDVGRGGTFLDTQGFEAKNSQYHFPGAMDPIPAADVTKINNTNGVEIIKLKDSGSIPATGESMPLPYNFEGKAVGALVNTKGTAFSGFAVKMNLVDGLTEEIFDQILSTFKFSTPKSSSDTSSWKTYTGKNGGYTIKYPNEEFVQIICPDEQFILSTRRRNETEDVVTQETCARDSKFEVQGGIYEGTKKHPSANNSYYKETYDIQEQTLVVGGYNAVEYTLTLKPNMNGPHQPWERSVYVNLGNKTFSIDFGNEGNQEIYNQILSTFKLTQ